MKIIDKMLFKLLYDFINTTINNNNDYYNTNF